MWDQSVKVSTDLDDFTAALTFIPCYTTKVEGDPLNKNRCRCCVPTLFGYGEKNWTNWIHKAGVSNSGATMNGDTGFHWPSVPGEMGFYVVSQADFLNGFYMPCGVVSEDTDKEKTTIIKEVKSANKKNEGHLHYYLKTPSGHTLAFTDKVGDEGVAIMHASGQGIFISGGFKGNNPNQNAKQETKTRTAQVRGDKSVITQTADSAGSVFRDGQGIISLLGQNGSGINVVDTKSGGTVLISTHASSGSHEGPSIYMSTEDGGLILLTAGSAQLQVRGTKGDIKVTKQPVQELPSKEQIEVKYTKRLKAHIKDFWKRAFNIEDAPSGGGQQGQSGQSSSSSGAQNTNMGNISPAPITNSDGSISGV
jgi:hypothetical protein